MAKILTVITSPAPGRVRFCLEAQVYYISAKFKFLIIPDYILAREGKWNMFS